jgi:hypothetical protein
LKHLREKQRYVAETSFHIGPKQSPNAYFARSTSVLLKSTRLFPLISQQNQQRSPIGEGEGGNKISKSLLLEDNDRFEAFWHSTQKLTPSLTGHSHSVFPFQGRNQLVHQEELHSNGERKVRDEMNVEAKQCFIEDGDRPKHSRYSKPVLSFTAEPHPFLPPKTKPMHTRETDFTA